MALRRTNNTKTSKFCKFCKSAGKSHSEYTSHYPKDQPGSKGKVICPTILSTECSYCHGVGHAKNHCPKLKTKTNHKHHTPHKPNKQTAYYARANDGYYAPKKREKQKRIKFKPNKKQMAFQNRYEMLMEADVVKPTMSQQLPVPAIQPAKKATGSWAQSLSSSVKEEKSFTKVAETVVTAKREHRITPTVPTLVNNKVVDSDCEKALEELYKIHENEPMVMWGDMSSDSEWSDSDCDE